MSNIKPAQADSSPLTDEVVQKVADELDELFAVEDAQEPAFLDDVRRILTSVWPNPPAQAAQVDRDAYEGAREDLLDWKGRAQRTEATLRSLGYVGVDASETPTAEPASQADVRPKHGDMHDGCGGYWCDYVQAEYKKPGPITLHESSVVRYVKLGLMCDKCGVERRAAESVGRGEATTTARLIEMCGDTWQSMNGYTDHLDKGSKGVASVEVVAIDLVNWCQVTAMASRGLHERITNENLASLQYGRLLKKYEEAEAGHAFERKRVLQCREALQAILPFIPVTSAIEGGASSYSENVRAADKVRAALALVGGAK